MFKSTAIPYCVSSDSVNLKTIDDISFNVEKILDEKITNTHLEDN